MVDTRLKFDNRFPALCVALATVIGLSSCALVGPPQSPDPSPPLTSATPRPASCPTDGEELGLGSHPLEQPIAPSPDADLSQLIWCHWPGEPRAKQVRVEERALTLTEQQQATLRLPDTKLEPNTACPAQAPIQLYVLARLDNHRAVRIRLPQNECGNPRPEVIATLTEARYEVVREFTVKGLGAF